MILFLASLIRKTISVSFQESFLGRGVWAGWGQPIIFQLLGGLQLGTGSWPLSINKPTAPLLSLPNMDNYTATRASGPPAFSSTLTFFAPFYSTSETAVSVKVNLRPYLRELFLARDPLYISLSPSIRLLFAQPLTTMGCFKRNQQIGMSQSSCSRIQQHATTESWLKIIIDVSQPEFVYKFLPWSWCSSNGNAFNGW